MEAKSEQLPLTAGFLQIPYQSLGAFTANRFFKGAFAAVTHGKCMQMSNVSALHKTQMLLFLKKNDVQNTDHPATKKNKQANKQAEVCIHF